MIAVNGVEKRGMARMAIPLLDYDSQVGGWAFGSNYNNYWCGGVLNANHNDGDYMTFTVYFEKGTYSLNLLTLTNTNAGIVDIRMDDVDLVPSGFDLYAASANNVSHVQTGIVVDTPGYKTIKIIIDGKNGSSSNHYAHLIYLDFWKTG